MIVCGTDSKCTILTFNLLIKVTHHIKKEVFDWWEETTTGRVEWRYSTLELGVLFQTSHGPVLMLQLCVNNLDILLKVTVA